ncbi:MAG: MarR family transcriptional regulator [Egibacteraceae bacterium]
MQETPEPGGAPRHYRFDGELFGDDGTRDLLVLLRALTDGTRRLSDAFAKALELHPSDLRAAELIGQHWAEPLRMGELGARLGLSSGAITGTVDRLERRGLVERQRDGADRRRTYLRLTPEGEAAAVDFYRDSAARLREAVAGFDADEREVIARFLAAAVAAVSPTSQEPEEP